MTQYSRKHKETDGKSERDKGTIKKEKKKDKWETDNTEHIPERNVSQQMERVNEIREQGGNRNDETDGQIPKATIIASMLDPFTAPPPKKKKNVARNMRSERGRDRRQRDGQGVDRYAHKKKNIQSNRQEKTNINQERTRDEEGKVTKRDT